MPGYICYGCQTDMDGNPENKVRDGVSTMGSARVLAQIHETLTGHSPEVKEHL